MDVNDLRVAVTVLSLVVFIGIVRWAWSRANRRSFAEAAWLPFADEPIQRGDAAASGASKTPPGGSGRE